MCIRDSWNTALFDANKGKILCSQDSGMRCSDAIFNKDGTRLYIAGGKSQSKKIKEGSGSWGRVLEYEVSISEES